MSKKIFSWVLTFALFSGVLLSQQSTEQQEKSPRLQHLITVTAERLKTPAKETASSVTIITREELDRSQKTTVLEALEEVLGVASIQNGPAGSVASVFLRGANSEHTLVMIDGVELNDPITPSRSFDLSHLSLDDVERIEILRGPQSTLYGSDAMAGVINIITRRGEGKTQASLAARGGSYGTFLTRAEISGGTGKILYSLGTSLAEAQGFSAASNRYPDNSEPDGFRNWTLASSLGVRLRDNLEVDFIFRRTDTKTEIDNFGGPHGDDPNHIQDYDSLLVKGQMRGLFFGNRWEQKINLSSLEYQRTSNNPSDDAHPWEADQSRFQSRRLKLDWQNNFFLSEFQTLTFGFEWKQEEGESWFQADGPWGSFSSFFPQRKALLAGLYLQHRLRLAESFFLTAGGRVDRHSDFGTTLTYRLAPAYFIKKTGTKLKATLGKGFKAPSLYQIYAPATLWGPVGNIHLKPEESTGFDFGLEQEIFRERIVFGATYFLNDFKNLIDFDFQAGYLNVARAEAKGIELLGKAAPGKGWAIQFSYTRTEAKDKAKQAYLIRRPKDKFSMNVSGKFLDRFDVSLSLVRVGRRDDLDFTTWPSRLVSLPAYTLLKAAVSYDLAKKLEVFVRLDNILDEEYEMVKGYGAPGFAVYGGTRIKF